jgi:hypothetical protein
LQRPAGPDTSMQRAHIGLTKTANGGEARVCSHYETSLLDTGGLLMEVSGDNRSIINRHRVGWMETKYLETTRVAGSSTLLWTRVRPETLRLALPSESIHGMRIYTAHG